MERENILATATGGNGLFFRAINIREFYDLVEQAEQQALELKKTITVLRNFNIELRFDGSRDTIF